MSFGVYGLQHIILLVEFTVISSSVSPHVIMSSFREFSLCICMWSRMWEDVHVCLSWCVGAFLSDAHLLNSRQTGY